VRNRLGDPESFVPEGPALGKRGQLGMAPGEVGTGEHRRQDNLAEALAVPRTSEERHGLPEAVDGPTIVALGMIGSAQVLVRQRVQDDLPAGRGKRQGALGGGDGLVIRAHEAEMDRQRERDLCQPTRIVEGRREGLGLAQIRQAPPKGAQRKER
jgi:hypothetical protein